MCVLSYGCVLLSSALPISAHWHVLCVTPADNGDQKQASSWKDPHQTSSPQAALAVPSHGMYRPRHEATKHVGSQHQSQCLLWSLPRALSSQEWAGYPGAKITAFPQSRIYTVWRCCVAVLVETIKGRNSWLQEQIRRYVPQNEDSSRQTKMGWWFMCSGN